jgi:LPXTG-motif cell wall-anchored protein
MTLDKILLIAGVLFLAGFVWLWITRKENY